MASTLQLPSYIYKENSTSPMLTQFQQPETIIVQPDNTNLKKIEKLSSKLSSLDKKIDAILLNQSTIITDIDIIKKKLNEFE